MSGLLRERAASDTFMKQKNSFHVRKKKEKNSHMSCDVNMARAHIAMAMFIRWIVQP